LSYESPQPIKKTHHKNNKPKITIQKKHRQQKKKQRARKLKQKTKKIRSKKKSKTKANINRIKSSKIKTKQNANNIQNKNHRQNTFNGNHTTTIKHSAKIIFKPQKKIFHFQSPEILTPIISSPLFVS